MTRLWSTRFRWKARVRTWQLTEHERSVEADLAAKTALALERERRKGEVEETSWQMFLALAAKARETLAFPLETESVSEDGKTIIREPARWGFGDAVRMLQIGDSLARLSLGMPVNRSEITGRDGAPLTLSPHP